MSIITGRWIDGLTAGLTTENLGDSETYQNLWNFNMPWQITEVGWYRNNTSHDPPLRMVVGMNGRGPMRVVDTLNDNGAVGWQWTTIDPVAGVPPNQPTVSAHIPPGGMIGRWTSAPDLPLYKEGQSNGQIPTGRRTNSYTYNDPGTAATLPVFALDVGYRLNTLAEAPDINLDVEGELARWLREDGDHYDEGVLKLAYGQAAGANEKAEANGTAIATLQTDLTTLGTRLSQAWADTIGSNTEGIPGFLTAWDAFYTQFVEITAPAVADLVEAIGDFTGITVLGYLAALIRFANGIDAPPQLGDTPDWELVDETDFVNNLQWPVEADVYRVHLTDYDPAGTSEPIGTLTRHAYLGKWSPYDGTFTREFHYFNTEDADLTIYRRLPGLALGLYRPGAGHVQAWRRTEAP